jgi:hypothetical protein
MPGAAKISSGNVPIRREGELRGRRRERRLSASDGLSVRSLFSIESRHFRQAFDISLCAVQRLWDAHRLQPHRLRTFNRSSDPKFVEKVEDVVGFTWIRPLMPSSSPLTRKAKFRRSTALSLACLSSRANAEQ